MWKSSNKDWHDLPEVERVEVDKSCNNGKHDKLTEEKGPGGGTGDYIPIMVRR